jgi:adenylate cyclase class 2
VKYEVEQKHPVSEFASLEETLRAMGVAISGAEEELDLYFAHPLRDFAETDEALRIRRKGDESWITYKGPKIDSTTKTRREIELPLGGEAATAIRWQGLLEELGFTVAGEVRKSRRRAEVPWEGGPVGMTLDEVGGLGTFVELEIQSDAAGIDAARSRLAELARRLGLEKSERRSYLELLLDRG